MDLDVLVGAGGWGYYPTLESDGLKAYAKAFSFVEVNTTFYQIPSLSAVRSWRRRVPGDFTFSVKCNGAVTHVHDLSPVSEVHKILGRMLAICRLLLSDMLVIQTPPYLDVDEAKITEVSKILHNVGIDGIRAYWEPRNSVAPEDKEKMRKAMLNEGIIPVVDLSREDPPVESSIVYSRLFSLGGPEYSDEQVRNIGRKVSGSGAERVILAFHGARMYRDAQRYKEINRE